MSILRDGDHGVSLGFERLNAIYRRVARNRNGRRQLVHMGGEQAELICSLHAARGLPTRAPPVPPIRASCLGVSYSRVWRNLSEFATTLTEDNAIAAAAIMGDSRMPDKG